MDVTMISAARPSPDRGMPIAITVKSGSFAIGLGLIAAVAALDASVADVAASDTLQVTNAWVPASDQTGVDLPFLMTVRNDAVEADAILRVRCPVSNFSEKHTIDRGEGAPAMRAIPSIPIPAGKTTELKRDGYHVMLLQTRQKLVDGETFTCAVVFQKAGTKETEVRVTRSP